MDKMCDCCGEPIEGAPYIIHHLEDGEVYVHQSCDADWTVIEKEFNGSTTFFTEEK